jgi:hypothetical protein
VERERERERYARWALGKVFNIRRQIGFETKLIAIAQVLSRALQHGRATSEARTYPHRTRDSRRDE